MQTLRTPSWPLVLLLSFVATAAVVSGQTAGSPQQAAVSSAGSGTPAFHRGRLPNGMEYILARIPSAPALHAELTYRAGAQVQTRETAGVFELIARTLASSSISGILPAAGNERFGFSLPGGVKDAEEALALLRSVADPAAIRAALDDPSSLERARAEAVGAAMVAPADPALRTAAALTAKLFSRAPWRKDSAGSPAVLRSVGSAALKGIVSEWFVPANSLLVLTGDFDAPDAESRIRDLFGDLPAGKNPWEKKPVAFPKPGVPRPAWIALGDPGLPAGTARVSLHYRGPDPLADPRDAASASLWALMAGAPRGRLAAAIRAEFPGTSFPDTGLARYEPSLDGSILSVEATIPSRGAATAAQLFKETVRGAQMYAMKTNAGYFTQAEYAQAVRTAAERRRAAFLTFAAGDDGSSAGGVGAVAGGAVPGGAVPGGAAIPGNGENPARYLADEWAIRGLDGWFDLPARLAALAPRDISTFVDTWFMKNLEVVILGLNPDDYASQRRSLASAGFELPGESNAFWWQR